MTALEEQFAKAERSAKLAVVRDFLRAMRPTEYQQLIGVPASTMKNHMAQLEVEKDSTGKINMVQMLSAFHRARAEANMLSGGRHSERTEEERSWTERRERAEALIAEQKLQRATRENEQADGTIVSHDLLHKRLQWVAGKLKVLIRTMSKKYGQEAGKLVADCVRDMSDEMKDQQKEAHEERQRVQMRLSSIAQGTVAAE